MTAMCRHCGAEEADRPRGLGKRCYYRPEVRHLYPVLVSPTNVRGFGVGDNITPPPPPGPTPYPPGSWQKQAVMRWRAENGFQVWHPRDARA